MIYKRQNIKNILTTLLLSLLWGTTLSSAADFMLSTSKRQKVSDDDALGMHANNNLHSYITEDALIPSSPIPFGPALEDTSTNPAAYAPSDDDFLNTPLDSELLDSIHYSPHASLRNPSKKDEFDFGEDLPFEPQGALPQAILSNPADLEDDHDPEPFHDPSMREIRPDHTPIHRVLIEQKGFKVIVNIMQTPSPLEKGIQEPYEKENFSEVSLTPYKIKLLQAVQEMVLVTPEDSSDEQQSGAYWEGAASALLKRAKGFSNMTSFSSLYAALGTFLKKRVDDKTQKVINQLRSAAAKLYKTEHKPKPGLTNREGNLLQAVQEVVPVIPKGFHNAEQLKAYWEEAARALFKRDKEYSNISSFIGLYSALKSLINKKIDMKTQKVINQLSKAAQRLHARSKRSSKDDSNWNER